MNDKNLHSDYLITEGDIFFRKGRIAWNKSESEVWAELQQKAWASAGFGKVFRLSAVLRWSAAAIVVLLLGLAATVQFYARTIESRPGEHLVAKLPDGSSVDLNAASSLTYYPLKWSFDRTVQFEGEGYFNVKKGKRFLVRSQNGNTQVLGTSFNIYARNDQYRVTCLTGKVRVSTDGKDQVLLFPNNHAELENGKLVVKEMFSKEEAIAWKSNQFYFANRPLREVVDEIERQYAVTIRLAPQLNNRNFGSNFSKKLSVEEVLNNVCKPMNLQFVKQAENIYLIVEKS